MNESRKRFAGRRIIVTGAASGIGLATAGALVGEGALVGSLDRTQTTIAGEHASAVVDLADAHAAYTAVETVARQLGGIDGVVCCAGVACGTPLADLDIDEWNRVMAINLTAPYVVARAALPWLRQARAAAIVNVGSATALLPSALAGAAYAASKGGLVVFTKALAAELAPHIRVNAVCPGLTDTPLMSHVLHSAADAAREAVGNYALRRAALPAEISDAILFLLGPESSFVNGVALAVDGGRTYH